MKLDMIVELTFNPPKNWEILDTKSWQYQKVKNSIQRYDDELSVILRSKLNSSFILSMSDCNYMSLSKKYINAQVRLNLKVIAEYWICEAADPKIRLSKSHNYAPKSKQYQKYYDILRPFFAN